MLADEYSIAPNVPGPDAAPHPTRILAPWLTGEVTLYIGLGLIALALRAAGLGTRPMDAPEASQALAAWQEAVACYTSQISTFWAGRAELDAALEAYWRSGGGTCLWRPDA